MAPVAKAMPAAKPRALDLFCGAAKSYQFACAYCGVDGIARRPDRKFCSARCGDRARVGAPKERACGHCGARFPISDRSDANRKYCSRKCSRTAGAKKIRDWKDERPGYMRHYNARRLEKDPSAYTRQRRAERTKMIEALGGCCVVCGVDNHLWLEIDYKPTTRGKPFRHPRGPNYVLKHIDDFRLLCANHHRELTLSGRIAGTEIIQ